MEKSDLKIKLKLVVDKKSDKVLFAESSKDFVDFLLSLLSLPLATILNLLKDGATFGSLSNLVRSIKSLDQTHIQSSKNLNSVLSPNPASIAFKIPLLDLSAYPSLFGYGYSPYFGEASSSAGYLGFVKGAVTYMILDSLEVKSLSSVVSYINLIDSFDIKDLSSLEERAVDVGPAQALKLLQASLQSENVLTSVFLNKKSEPY